MDKVLLSMATILISATGILGSMMRFDCPELAHTYFGSNPFAIKKRYIDKVVQRIFVFLAVCGLAIQGYPIFNAESVPNKIHSDLFYVDTFVIGLVIFPIVAYSLKSAAYANARRYWLPILVKEQREGWGKTTFVINNDGWRADQLAAKEMLAAATSQGYRQANLTSAREHVVQLETLFELKPQSDDLKIRADSLQKFFP